MTMIQATAASGTRRVYELAAHPNIAGGTIRAVLVRAGAVDATTTLVPTGHLAAVADDDENYMRQLSTTLREYRTGKRVGLSIEEARGMLGL